MTAGTRIGRDVLHHIGRTPLVPLERIGKGLPVHVLVKCEHMNPGGSRYKDPSKSSCCAD